MNDVLIETLQLTLASDFQGSVAEGVDDARNAGRDPLHCGNRIGCERHHRRGGGRETSRNVVLYFVARQRVQFNAARNPLIELPQIRLPQHRFEIRLADQNDLQQLGAVGFEVRQQPDLFENRRREMLRLVDQDDRMRVQRDQRRQELVQRLDQLMACSLGQRFVTGARFG